ncbi:MAG: phytoene desaturase family protein [Balneolales bacterium]
MKKTIIIGSGFGGLSAAARLAARGWEVEIYEKRDKPGGRAYVYEKNGFTFDGGPTVITAPFMFDDIFRAFGKNREDYIQFRPCNPYYRIFDATGRHFDYTGDEGFILDEIRKWNRADAQGYLKFVKATKAIFNKGFVDLADKPFLSVWDMIKVVPDLLKLQSYKSVYSYVSQFIEDDFLRRVFSFHPLLVGGNPFDTTSIYAMIHYLEREWGVHFAAGGTGAIVEGLMKLLGEAGVKVRLNAEVDEIVVKAGRASGIRLKDGSYEKADAVVSNADVAYTYTKMMQPADRKRNSDKRYRRTKYSMSLFVVYFGTKRRYTDTRLRHHNIILGTRYKELLHDVFNKKHLSGDFSLYLHMPTYSDESLAPPGCESFYVLSPVPHLGSGTDWKKEARPYRNAIMQFLEDNYLPGLQDNIIAEHYIDPLHFQNTLNSYCGAAFSVQPLLTQSAWFRPHNRSEDIDNLYFVGAGTHPGAGLPGVLSSAKIAEQLMDKELYR